MWGYSVLFLLKASQKTYGIIYVRKKKIPNKKMKPHVINEKNKETSKLKREWERTQNKHRWFCSQANLYLLKEHCITL